MPKRFDVRTSLTETSINIPVDLAFNDWLATGESLLKLNEAVRFALGDVIIYGFQHYGEMAAQLISSQNTETCRKARYVCERIPPERRRAGLKFRHHDAVASLVPELQDELLELAERHNWDSDTLRAEGRRRRDLPPQNEQQEEPEIIPEIIPPPSAGLVKRADVGRRPGQNSEESESIQAEQMEQVERVERVERHDLIPPRPTGAPTDEDAIILHSIAKTASSREYGARLLRILDERNGLLKIFELARRAVEMGQMTPELAAAFGKEI